MTTGGGSATGAAPDDVTRTAVSSTVAGPGPVGAVWSVVMPVKGGDRAKSRLRDPRRAALARSVALDAVAAALACPAVAQVVVVTADATTAQEHEALGATVVADPGAGLDGALLAGAAACHRDRPCALLLADLPSLRPTDLRRVLDDCLGRLEQPGPGGDAAAMVTVPDADGHGTVLLAAARPAALRPRFGPGSAQAHARLASVLDRAPAGVRRDVDTDEHLREAVTLGVGPRTAQVLAAQPRSTMAPRAASFSPKRS
ncbi:2-phospho-L-lactate guanylyltransferase [Jannaschia sp. R86511]|uniref:2-phospho-L-lactate guanylyltransferase n=1 Tax=Jannaschia sp. R86511 TaxID=3093853 RepID=UPI0036D39417